MMRPFSSAPSPPSLVSLLLIAVVILAVNNGNVEAFSPLSSSSRIHQSASATTRHASSSTIMSAWNPFKASSPSSSSSSSKPRPAFLEQLAGESDSAYFKRLSQTASDPAAFEKMVLGDQQKGDVNSTASPEATKEVAMNYSRSNSKDDGTDNTVVDDKKRQRGYQRAEEWEADQAKEQKKLSWEERVQFDGQRHGNKFNQNEILRKNLHR